MRPYIIFIFGLLHGLGFAGVLKEIGISDGLFFSSLVSFNVGVELGQISIILLSLAGLPPLAGFIAKFYIFKAIIIADYLWIAVVGIMGSVISAYYYLNIVKVMYLDEAEELFKIGNYYTIL